MDALVVAIVAAVVVAAVLAAVVVASLLPTLVTTPPGEGPRVLGVLNGRSSDGTNWTLTFTSVPSGLSTSAVRLTILSSGGSTALAPTAFASLSYSLHHAAYVQYVAGSTVAVGDRLLIRTTVYPTGYTYQIADATSILAAGTLAG